MKKTLFPLVMIIYALLVVGMVYGVFVNTEYEDMGWICMVLCNMLTCANFIYDYRGKIRQDNSLFSKIWLVMFCLIQAVFAVCLIIWVVRLF